MRFADLLRTTVLLSAGAATALAAACVAGATNDPGSSVGLQAVVWWLVAAAIGVTLARRGAATPPIARALAEARVATAMPEERPWPTVINRLWPLLVATTVAGALAFLAPQVPGIAAGFAIIWALGWRFEDRAVVAVEERDGVTFFVERSAPWAPVKLVRLPGMRREVPELFETPA